MALFLAGENLLALPAAARSSYAAACPFTAIAGFAGTAHSAKGTNCKVLKSGCRVLFRSLLIAEMKMVGRGITKGCYKNRVQPTIKTVKKLLALFSRSWH